MGLRYERWETNASLNTLNQTGGKTVPTIVWEKKGHNSILEGLSNQLSLMYGVILEKAGRTRKKEQTEEQTVILDREAKKHRPHA